MSSSPPSRSGPRVRVLSGSRRVRRVALIHPLLCLSFLCLNAAGGLGVSKVALLAADDESKAPGGKEIKTKIRQAILAGDDAALAMVLRKAGTIPGREATNALLTTARTLPKEFVDAYWLILDGAASFTHGDAFTEMGDYILRNRRDAVAVDLINALRRSKSKYLGRVIRQMMETNNSGMQLMAIDLAPNARVRRTVDILMPYLKDEYAKENGGKNDETEVKKRLIYALEALTLQRFGNSVPNWTGWWAANRHRGLKILREEAETQESTTGVARAIDPIRERQFIGLEKMPEGTVLVIKGERFRNGGDSNFDHIEDMLSKLKIPHDVVERPRLEDKKFSLRQYAAIFINCAQINELCQNPDHNNGGAYVEGKRANKCVGPGAHDPQQCILGPQGIKKLETWTEAGGFLFTEDWVLVELLEPLWSKFIAKGSGLEGFNVGIRPSRGFTAHSFLRGVFVPPPKIDWTYDEEEEEVDDDAPKYDPTVEDDENDIVVSGGRTGVAPRGPDEPGPEVIVEPDIELIRHEWKIDKDSPSLNIRSKKVEVLIVSPELGKQTGGDDAVAVTFPVKKGRVLHVLSHFGKQSSSHNEATLENVLINFLIEVNVRAQRTK